MDLLPGVGLVVIGLLVLAGWRQMADFFTDVQQRDPLFASRDASLFQRINTVLFGLALTGLGVAMMLGWV